MLNQNEQSSTNAALEQIKQFDLELIQLFAKREAYIQGLTNDQKIAIESQVLKSLQLEQHNLAKSLNITTQWSKKLIRLFQHSTAQICGIKVHSHKTKGKRSKNKEFKLV
jgi:hypothetical protein